MKTLLRTALFATLPLAAASAQIAPPPAPVPPPPPPAATGAGETLAQYQARQSERMMAADADRDGRISLAEWTAQASGRHGGSGGGGGGGYDPSAMFARMDLNHDGYLDRSEIDAASAERFRRMDSNGDGIITPEERMASHGGMGHGGHGGHGGHHGYGGRPDDPAPPAPQPQP